MKKMMKKLIAVAAALVMIVTLLPAVGVKAEVVWQGEKGTITIRKLDSDKTTELTGGNFDIYQIATAQQVNDNGTIKIQYTKADNMDEDLFNKLLNTDVTDKGDLNEIALDIRTHLRENADPIASISGGATTEKIAFGIYLIDETVAPTRGDGTTYVPGAPILVQLPQMQDGEWVEDITVSPKNAKNDLQKTIISGEDEDGNEFVADDGTVQANSIITYKVSGTVPYLSDAELEDPYASIEISDTLKEESKLSFAGQNITFTFYDSSASGADVLGTETVQVNEGDKTFTLNIPKDKLATYTGKYFEVTYKVQVGNITAEDVDDLNINKATIKKNGNANPGSPEVPVYTFGIKITKTGVDKTGTGSKPLGGVEFGLYPDNDGTIGETAIVKDTTDRNGYLTFNGLNADDNNGQGTVYWLKEEATVNGYTLLANPIKVTLIPVVSADGKSCTVSYKIDNQEEATPDTDRVADVTVENQKGFSLPETGGMGTYLFTIGGIVIMAGAAFALIAMKKRA